MEVSGTLLRRVPYISAGARTYDTRYCSSSSLIKPSSVSLPGGRGFKAKQRNLYVASGFCDNGHVEYYQMPKIRCGGSNKVDKKKNKASMSSKKKLKLLKDLTESLSMVSDLNIALDSESSAFIDQIRGQIKLDTAEVLLKRLEHLKAQEKELKRQKKQEKAMLKKASKMNTNHGCESSSSSSSSESSDDECDEVVDMNFMRQGSVSVSVAPQSTTLNETRPDAKGSTVFALPGPLTPEENKTQGIRFEDHSKHEVGSCSRMTAVGSVQTVTSKRIEVCMGNKCKKLGSAVLLEEFGKAMGDEGSVFGCKCMGKCRNGPNVRILNFIDNSFGEGANDSVRTPANPLCLGVGVEDVNVILSNYFGEDQKYLGMSVEL